MNLSDFDTLALAQSHEVTVDKKKVGSGQARGFLVTSGIWKILRGIQADNTHDLYALADAIILTASDAESYFGLDSSTAEGQSNIVGAQFLVDAEIMTSEQRDYFLSMAVTTNYPYASKTEDDWDARDIEEILNLDSNLNMHSVSLNISTKPDTPARISIQHRFGKSGNLTDWHEVGSIGSVLYTQQTFQSANIPACTAQIREMRAVCEQTLGMSIA